MEASRRKPRVSSVSPRTGSGGPTPETARFVPPPVLGDARFTLSDRGLPPRRVRPPHTDSASLLPTPTLRRLHPFLDGNGRVGRLLITFMLVHERVLREPILYLSIFFKRHRQEYYDRLQAIREKGDWEGWLAFFLEAVASVSEEATTTARHIVNLREETRAEINQRLGRRAGSALDLLEELFRTPIVTVKQVKAITGLSQPAANALTNALEKVGVLRETTGRKTYRMFAFDRYMQLFSESGERG